MCTDCKNRITGVVNFVDGNLRPVKSETDPDLSKWYRDNSLVYVSRNHACWENEELKRKVLKKRFGGVRRSTHSGLARMMEEHSEEVHEWITKKISESQSGETSEME